MFKKLSCAALIALSLGGCGPQGPKKYIRIIGGGISFNYRYSKATLITVIKTLSPLPQGGQIEAQFEVPGKTEPNIVTMAVVESRLTYSLESDAMLGIKKDVPLHVTILARDAKGEILDTDKTQYISDTDQEGLPTKPLMDPNFPGYIPLPENLK